MYISLVIFKLSYFDVCMVLKNLTASKLSKFMHMSIHIVNIL